jgi:hypothetical protein
MKYKGNNVETLTHSKKAVLDRAMKPYDALSEGPFRTSLDKMEGVFRKEVVTWKKQNGKLIIETASRDFRDNDYFDTTRVEVVATLED